MMRDAPERPCESEDGWRCDVRVWCVVAAFAVLGLGLWLFPKWVGGAAAEGLDARLVGTGLAVFCCIALLWLTEAVPLAATALVVPVLAAGLGVMNLKSGLASFADPLIFIFFGGFALAAGLARQGIDHWIAGGVVRAGGGHFLPVALLMFGVTAFLSMWMSNTATTALMLPLALGILRKCADDEAVLRNRVFLLLGLAYASSIGGLGTVIGSPPNGIAAKALGMNFSQWMAFGVPAVAVLLPAMAVLLMWLCRPSRGLRMEVKREEPFVWNGARRVTVGIFAAVAAGWIFGGKLGPLLGILESFDTAVALAGVFALLFFRVVKWSDIDRGTDWGVLLLFGGGIALSNVLRDTEASLFLARLLAGAVAGWQGVFVIAAVVAFVIFLTELSSNTATAALLVPVFMAMAGELGMEGGSLVMPLALAASCAFMLPVATPPNAIVYGTGMVPQREMMRAGLVLNVVFVGLLTVLSRLLLR